MKLNIDNVGAIYMVKNQAPGQRTKHVDVRYSFVKDLVEEGTIEVSFVKTENNLDDIFTKNVKESLNERLTETYMDKRA